MAMVYAVLTGDIVGSSRLEAREQLVLKDSLKQSFKRVRDMYPDTGPLPSFDVFRGDSFQGVLDDAVYALETSLLIRANLRKDQPPDQEVNWDARIAIGIGEIDYLPDNVSEGDGPAYRSSGPVLDRLKKDIRLEIHTPWQEVNDELNTECALLDALIAGWTPPQAEAVVMLLEGKDRKQIGRELKISQAAVHYRVKGSGWFAVEKFINRYHTIITKNIN